METVPVFLAVGFAVVMLQSGSKIDQMPPTRYGMMNNILSDLNMNK